MSFFSRARRRLLRRPPKSPSATSSSETPTLSPISPSTLQSTTPTATVPDPNSSNQSQDPDREPEEGQLGNEDDRVDGEGGDEDGEEVDTSDSDTSSSDSDGEDVTPNTPSNPPATSDTDVDIAASGTPPANPLFPSTITSLSTKSRAWLSPDPAALKPQLFLDLSKMTPFASPSGRPFGNAAVASNEGVYTFGSDPKPQETGFRSTGLGLTYGQKYTNNTVTLKIGTDEISFQIHKSILTKSCPIFDKMLNGPFKDSTQSEVRLDEDDPDAFGLIVDWLYTGRMAMFNPTWVNKSLHMNQPGSRSGDDMIHVPLPSYFGTPTASHELAPNGATGPYPYQAMFQHICTQSLYAGLSPEEIRLVEHFPANKDVVLDYVAFLQGRGAKTEDRPATKDQAQFLVTPTPTPVQTDAKVQQMLEYLQKVEQIPVPVPFAIYIEAEYLQLVLIKVLITADKYLWEDLFNDAMDAFRVGEQHLGRRHPVVRHIELAYMFCPRKSPLVTLMADMAFYAGKAYQSHSELVEVSSRLPDFRQDLSARWEKQISIPGYDPVKDALKLFRGPLSKAGGTYHYHPTKDSLTGPCPPHCVKRHRERAMMQF